MRVHLFPSRTQKLSSSVPTILAGRLAGKIGYANMIARQGFHCLASFGILKIFYASKIIWFSKLSSLGHDCLDASYFAALFLLNPPSVVC